MTKQTSVEHREGPWIAQYDDNGFYSITSTVSPYQAITIIAGESDRDKADADLIASAPDMIKALLALDAISTDYIRGHNPKEWALLDHAIKKAKGN